MWLLSPKANAKLGKESKELALGCFKVYFSWPSIDFLLDVGNLSTAEVLKVSLLGHLFPDELVCTLYCALLPKDKSIR